MIQIDNMSDIEEQITKSKASVLSIDVTDKQREAPQIMSIRSENHSFDVLRQKVNVCETDICSSIT